MIIWDGSHRVDTDDPSTQPIGTLRRADGTEVRVYRDDITGAFTEACGPVPVPPAPLPPGALEPSYGSVTVDTATGPKNIEVVTGYTYDQGPGDFDKAQADTFAAEVAAWTAHAQNQKAALDELVRELTAK